MTEFNKRIYTVAYRDHSYPVEADPWTTFEMVWASQRCWFMPGTVVTITDDKGISKTFVKE